MADAGRTPAPAISTRESAPSDPHRRRTDADNPWVPDPGNMSPEAGLKRDNMAAARLDALEAADVRHEEADKRHEAAMEALNGHVKGLNERLDGWGKRWDDFRGSLRSVALWALKIVGGSLLLAFVVWAIATAPRVRIDPPALQGPAAPR